MSNNWNDLGEQIRETVDSAIRSGDFSDLSRSLGNIINSTIDMVKENAFEHIVVQEPRRTSERVKHRTAAEQVRSGQQEAAQPPRLFTPNPHGRILGILMAAFGYAAFLVFAILLLVTLGLTFGGIIALPVIATGIYSCLAALSLGLGLKGTSKIRLVRRYRQYVRALNQRISVPVAELAKKTGKSLAFTLRDLKHMISMGYFFQAHIDEEDNYFLLSDKSYQDYIDARDQYRRQQLLETQKKEAQTGLSDEVKKIMDEGAHYVQIIRTSNDQIPDAEVSAKLDQMENVVSRIFEVLRAHPEVAPDLKKMMNYYLPTTAKLLDAYRELDAQPVAGAHISSTKKEIEDAIDTLNAAFETLLDNLYEDKAWDISSDISVLNTILAQEGLKKDALKKEN